eukprot:Rhum_TRINITY_DN18550_c0_g1::Rhum_TRINITY_DN18550_c0_g1_i1::g.167608::m.167608/K10688/UBE2W, UBC16; ubiquitin-conjugating enzyme E2 W
MEKRISRELEKMRSAPPPGISIPDSNVISATEWHLCLTYPEGNLYTGMTFKLRFRFGPKYPMDSPEVVFIENVPVHEHIYSNGHICMDILYDAWTPAMTVSTVAQSIYSMLSGAGKESYHRPSDDVQYTTRCKETGQSPKQTKWDFHDAHA